MNKLARRFLKANSAVTGLLSAAGFVVALAGSGFSGPAAAGVLQQQTITVSGVQRTYYISTPPGFPQAGRKYSAMFVLHGGGSNGQQVAATSQMVSYADRLDFVAIFPDAYSNKQWNLGNQSVSDVAFMNAIVDEKVAQGTVNAARVFVAGISSGGEMTQRLACQSNRFAAFGVVVANLPSNYVTLCKPLKQNIPIEFFLGTADPAMPYNGGPVAGTANHGAGGTVVSAADTINLWANYGGCTGEQVLALPDRVNDGTHVIRHTSTGCRQGAEVIFFEVVNGGHCWPGANRSQPNSGLCTKNVNASDEIVHFFQAYGL